MSEERLERIEGKVDILVSGQIDLGVRVSKLEERLADVDGNQGELRAAVVQIAEGHAAHTRQIARGFRALHTALDKHHPRPMRPTLSSASRRSTSR